MTTPEVKVKGKSYGMKYYKPAEKMTCDVCGGTYFKGNTQRHLNSQKHQSVVRALNQLHQVQVLNTTTPPTQGFPVYTEPQPPPMAIMQQQQPVYAYPSPPPNAQFQRWSAYANIVR